MRGKARVGGILAGLTVVVLGIVSADRFVGTPIRPGVVPVREEDSGVRLEAAGALLRLKVDGQWCRETLYVEFRSGSPVPLGRADQDLDRVIPVLLKWSRAGYPLEARRAAITALREIGPAAAVPSLERALRDPNERVAANAAAALSSIRGE